MRVKRGVTAHKRHKKLKKAAKGMQHTHQSSPRRARQAVTRSMQYQHRDRRNKKRDFHRLWVTRINAAARQHGISYSRLMNQLKESEILLDRKVLAEIAVNQPHVFEAIVKSVKDKK